jgi:hypothetical protein
MHDVLDGVEMINDGAAVVCEQVKIANRKLTEMSFPASLGSST